MITKLNKIGYSLKDVSILQAPISNIYSRTLVNPFTEICGRESYPIFVAPMASVTDENNYQTWIDNKCCPVIPRSVDFEVRLKLCTETYCAFSLKEAAALITFLDSTRKRYICIDLAHGTMKVLYGICKSLKDKFGYAVEIMTGNVANPLAYPLYADAGIDWMRASIGTGARCLTSGTKIAMYNNEDKNIEDVKIGDVVQTMNGPKKVLNTFCKETDSTIIINDQIECTPDHKFFVVEKSKIDDIEHIDDDFIKANGIYIEAKDLNDNYLLVTS